MEFNNSKIRKKKEEEPGNYLKAGHKGMANPLGESAP